MKAFLQPINIPVEAYQSLLGLASDAISNCRVTADDGTAIFRPDGGGHYDAMWTRDFCYMVEGAGRIMDAAEILAAIDYLLSRQRDDGTVPERVTVQGEAIYLAGPPEAPLGSKPPTDNGSFMVKAMSAYMKLTRDHAAFLERRNALYLAIDAVPLSDDQLVFIDPNVPHAGYGFTDCIAKTGNVFFSTLLYWEACQTLARLCADAEYHDEAHEWYERAEKTVHRMDDFWDEDRGLFLAASGNCRQVDLWGSVYACVIRIASKSQARQVAESLRRQWDDCVLKGHLRHLPGGEYWHRTIVDVPRDTYQSGGYWATPSGWLAKTMHLLDEELARKVIRDLLEEFTSHGVHEWIVGDERHVPGYVASVANVLGAVQSSQRLR